LPQASYNAKEFHFLFAARRRSVRCRFEDGFVNVSACEIDLVVPSGEFGGSFALDLVAFLASEEADRVAYVFGFEPPSRVPNATMPPARPKPTTLAADKAYDAGEFVHELRSVNATPHVAQNTHPPLVGVRRPYHAPCRLRFEPKHP
jgi:hypothetical protein